MTILLSLVFVSFSVLMSCERLCEIQDEIGYHARSYAYFKLELTDILQGDSQLAGKLVTEKEFEMMASELVDHGFEYVDRGENPTIIEISTLDATTDLLRERLESAQNDTPVEPITDLLVQTLTYWDEALPRYDEFVVMTQFITTILSPSVLVMLILIKIICIIGLWITQKPRKGQFIFMLFLSFFVAGTILLVFFLNIHEITYYDPSANLNDIRKHYVHAIANEVSQQLYELGSIIMMGSIAMFVMTSLMNDIKIPLISTKSSV